MMLPTTCALAQDLTSAQANRQLDKEEIASPKSFLSRIEAMAGINYSKPYGNDFLSKNGSAKTGYVFGLTASHDFSRIISLDLSILYERKNSETQQDILDQSVSPAQNSTTIDETGINYLTIASIASLRLGVDSKFFLGMGGYYSFLRGFENTQTVLYSGVVRYYSYSSSTIGKKDFDAGLIFNVKYRYPLSVKYDLYLQVMNARGITDTSSEQYSFLPVYKNNTYSILIGLTLKK